MENSCSKVFFIISRKLVSLQFNIVNSHSRQNQVISVISHKITLKLISFPPKITKNGANYHSWISCFTHLVKIKSCLHSIDGHFCHNPSLNFRIRIFASVSTPILNGFCHNILSSFQHDTFFHLN